MNVATSFLDLSQIYGGNILNGNKRLRSLKGGKLHNFIFKSYKYIEMLILLTHFSLQNQVIFQ
jgi:hypothetical protein